MPGKLNVWGERAICVFVVQCMIIGTMWINKSKYDYNRHTCVACDGLNHAINLLSINLSIPESPNLLSFQQMLPFQLPSSRKKTEKM